MIRPLIIALILLTPTAGTTTATTYHLQPAHPLVYQITIRGQFPNRTITIEDYLTLWPKSVTADGTFNIARATEFWSRTTEGDFPSKVFGNQSLLGLFDPQPPKEATEETVDPKKGIQLSSAADQIDDLPWLQGNRLRLVLPPLPSADQTTWTVHRAVTIHRVVRNMGNNLPVQHFLTDPSPDPTTPASETITYKAEKPKAGQLTIDRKYDLVTQGQTNNKPAAHIYGDGKTIFDIAAGHVISADWQATYDYAEQDVTAKVPIKVTARLLSPGEITRLKEEVTARLGPQERKP